MKRTENREIGDVYDFMLLCFSLKVLISCRKISMYDLKKSIDVPFPPFSYLLQQGRNNAPVIAIKIYQCKIAAKPRPPGVETPGYSLTSLSGLIVSCYKMLIRSITTDLFQYNTLSPCVLSAIVLD